MRGVFPVAAERRSRVKYKTARVLVTFERIMPIPIPSTYMGDYSSYFVGLSNLLVVNLRVTM
jgi:hypothetical protein